MSDRRRMWRQFRQKWLRDDSGPQTHEPATTHPAIPLSIWQARRKVRCVVFLSKSFLFNRWVDQEIELPPDWAVVERRGFPDEQVLALLAHLQKQFRAPWYYVGDLDPLDLTTFLAVRALAVDFVGRRHALPMRWVGVTDSWLALARRWCDPKWGISTHQMSPLEHEHWRVLREVAPELPAAVGPECTRILDCGESLDIIGVANCSGKPAYGARLLKHLATTVRTTRRP